MCGICGLATADLRATPGPGPLAKMTAVLSHRGPDGEGSHRSEGIALGVRRLAVIDPAGGSQPIANEDGSVTVVCNGEIYNAPELRRELEQRGHRFRSASDVEVIVHLYEELGEDLLPRLRGMFALALWDGRRRRLLLARDRVGIKPLVYTVRPDGLWFASEAKAIVAGGGCEPRASLEAINDLLDYGFVVGERTLFAGVQRLLPGHLLCYSHGGVEVRQWWRWPLAERDSTRSAGEWAEVLRAKLREVVSVHLRSDVPVGAWLSTGLDSSAVTALARSLSDRPLPAYTLEMPGSGWDETRGRRTLAELPGHEAPSVRVACRADAFSLLPAAVWHVEEPSPAVMEIGRMLLARAAAREVKVVLTGEGADELFYGYGYFRLDRAARLIARLPGRLRRAGMRLTGADLRRPRLAALLDGPQGLGPVRFARLVGPGVVWTGRELRGAALRQAVERDDSHLEVGDGRASTGLAALLRRSQLPDQIVHTLDRGSMAFGVEARVPFLDHELIELCADLPPRLAFSWLREKIALRNAVAGVVPDEIRGRPKHAPTVPFEAWLHRPLPAFAARLLDPAELRRKGYFDDAAVAELLARHRAGRGLYGTLLMVVLAVHLWDELFIRGVSAADLASE